MRDSKDEERDREGENERERGTERERDRERDRERERIIYGGLSIGWSSIVRAKRSGAGP